jgi:signal transduction histidine kinase
MLANVIENAIRHTPAGTGIHVSLTKQDGSVVVEITDDGPGVPEADRNRIFRRFYRLEQSLSKAGSGLGLALVAAVAELHGIKLVAGDNRPGLRMIMSFGSQLPQRKDGRTSTGAWLVDTKEERIFQVQALPGGVSSGETASEGVTGADWHSQAEASA